MKETTQKMHYSLKMTMNFQMMDYLPKMRTTLNLNCYFHSKANLMMMRCS